MKRRVKDVLRHMERAQQPARAKLSQKRHQHAAQNRNHDRGMDRLFDGAFVSSSDGVCDDVIAAERNAKEQVHNQTDNRRICPDCGNRRRAVLRRKIADRRDIRGVEQLPENRCRCNRQCKARQPPPDGPMQHVVFLFAHKILLRIPCISAAIIAPEASKSERSALLFPFLSGSSLKILTAG